MNLRPYSPGDWERLCAMHDAARVHELQASGLADAFLSLEQTAENEGLLGGEVVVAVLVDRQSRPAGVLADRCRDGADAGRHGTEKPLVLVLVATHPAAGRRMCPGADCPAPHF